MLTINNVTASDAATNYNVVITGICNPAAISNNVTLTVNPIPVAVAASNSPVLAGNPIQLSTPNINGGTYLWTGPFGFASTVQNPEIASATSADAGLYTLSVTALGCPSAPVTINVEVIHFSIPEGFSPNADGINDMVVIRGIDYYPGNSITIFNRWGNKVFEASPYTNNWDGTNSFGITIGGDELPVGTYFYILDLGNDSDVIKGNIFLNR
jgi:gliding motility-associated-like protein